MKVSPILPITFGLALFASSFLMFTLEPFIAKLLLPYLGGSANVWNTCVVFFQLTLVAGYLYSHLISHLKVPVERLKWFHLPVLLLPLLATSFIVPVVADSAELSPVLWLLATLVSMIGALFFSLSTVAPLLQKWYSNSPAPGSQDPYFLYAASNAGSLAGLLLYPLLIESSFSLSEQGNLIYWSYGVVALVVFAASFSVRSIKQEESESTESHDPKHPIKAEDYLRWLLYTSIPASLMLGVTTYVSTELSALPFFWVVPLFIYLLSFVICFSRPPKILLKVSNVLAPLLALVVLVMVFKQAVPYEQNAGEIPITEGISIHLAALFLISLALHGKLADERPNHTKLTQYFLCISIGGVLGSSFNTFLAPLIFNAWIEYPLILSLAAVSLMRCPEKLQSFPSYKRHLTKRDLAIPLLVLVVAFISWKLCQGDMLTVILIPLSLTVVATILSATNTNQLRSGLSIALSALVLTLFSLESNTVYRSRNFFGCLKVSLNRVENTCQFWHGITIHGVESLDPALRGKPQAYFHRSGPIGELLTVLNKDKQDPLAVVGLGAGSLAAYANPGQKMYLYEINPDVVKIASDPFYFSYLFQARKRGVALEIVEGDGRLKLKNSPYQYFGLIIVDAFNSDSIPTHLLTREALKLYESKLKTGGTIAFQVTNNYYNLKPLLAALAKERGAKALFKNDYSVAREQKRYPTEWVVLTKDHKSLEQLKELHWKELVPKKRVKIWTDDYSNPLELLMETFS